MNTEKAKLMRKIQIACFAINEVALYLDGHPTNKMALSYYDKVKREHKELTDKYEKTYGPLTFYNAGGPSWTWVQGSWPWQQGMED